MFIKWFKLLLLLVLQACQSGTHLTEKELEMDKYDVLVVGGSHAGLSAAMALGRMQRSVLVVDGGGARNRFTNHAQNIAGLDGKNPSELRADARRDLEEYKTVEYKESLVISIHKNNGLFEAKLKSGESIKSRKIILAYGVKDNLPSIDGIWEIWGKSIFHCPYCHGYEFRNKKIGIIGNGHYLDHMIPMMLNISSELILLPQGGISVSEKLNQKNIKTYESKIKSFIRSGENLKGVILHDGTSVELSALLVAPVGPVELSSSLGADLGCEKNEDGFLVVDAFGKTTIEGVFAAGDITTRFHSVVQALASGQKAGATAVMELSQEDF